jgi:hypothetical protein
MLSLLSKVCEAGETEDGNRKWSLIILKDAGEFIAMDSRHQYGQALAKLLNLSDGLLGQGQKLLFLIYDQRGSAEFTSCNRATWSLPDQPGIS